MKSSTKVLTCALSPAAFPALSQDVPYRASPSFYAGQRVPGTVTCRRRFPYLCLLTPVRKPASRSRRLRRGFTHRGRAM